MRNRVGLPPEIVFGADTNELADLARLSSSDVFNLSSVANPEGAARTAAATIDTAGMAVNRKLTDSLAAYVRYRYAGSNEDDSSRTCSGYPVAWLPRHQADAGMTLSLLAQWRLQSAPVYRSSRWRGQVSQCDAPMAEDVSANFFAEWHSDDRRAKLNGGLNNWKKGQRPQWVAAFSYDW